MAIPKPNFIYTINILEVSFSDKSLNVPTSWAWDFGDGNVSELFEPYHNYNLPGIYNVQLISVSENGCRDTIVNNIEIIEEFRYNGRMVCDGFEGQMGKKKKKFRSLAKDLWEFERLFPQYLNQKYMIFLLPFCQTLGRFSSIRAIKGS